MDNEPLEEFMLNQHIWELQDKRRRRDEKRDNQASMRYNDDRG